MDRGHLHGDVRVTNCDIHFVHSLLGVVSGNIEEVQRILLGG